jgi:hypothetical protein
MRRFVKIAGIAVLVAVLAVGAVSAVALAQEGTDDESGWNFRDRLHQAIASILGISVDEYEAAVDAAEDQVLDEAVADDWLTQEQADRLRERLDAAPGFGRWDKGFPFMGRMPGVKGVWGMRGESLYSIAADKLGMELSNLMAEFQDGKSIADLAAEKGVDTQEIADAYLVQFEEQLADAVANEDITQKQADLMLENMAEQVTSQIEAACGGCLPGGFRGHGGRGGFFGFPRGMGLPCEPSSLSTSEL